MNIKQHNINDLIFAEYNPRQLTKEQYKNLKDSIKRFGLVDPVIINKNKERKNIVIGGHQRLKIAKDRKEITNTEFWDLYKKIGGNTVRNIAHLRMLIDEKTAKRKAQK